MIVGSLQFYNSIGERKLSMAKEREILSPEEWERTLENCQKAIDEGDKDAIMIMASMRFCGREWNEQNIEAAFPYFKMGADLGDSLGAQMVADHYLNQLNDEVNARKYYAIAAKGDSKKYQYVYALCCLEGIGGQADYNQAIKYLEKVVISKYEDSTYQLWRAYALKSKFCEEELDSLKYTHEGMYWLACACAEDNPDAIEDAEKYGLFGQQFFIDDIESCKQFGPQLKENRSRRSVSTKNPENSNKYNTNEERNVSQESSSSGGCYVATCVYGSYDCPEVWTLRRFRDNTLANSIVGRLFIKFYYTVSPTIVKWFGNTEVFKNFWKIWLDKLVTRLQHEGVESSPYWDK